MRSVLVVIASVFTLAACSGESTEASPTEPETVTETVEVEVPTADPTEAETPDPAVSTEPNVGDRALQVGQSRVGTAVTTTLLEVRDPYPPAEFRQPEAGNRFIGLRISQCIADGADTSAGDYISTYNGEWITVTSDNDEYPGSGSYWNDWPLPKFPESVTITPGSCVKGWIAPEVPINVKWDRFVFRPQGETVAEWFAR